MRDKDKSREQLREELFALRQLVDELQGLRVDQAKLTTELQRTEDRYRQLYENAPHAYFSVGTDGLIRNVNARASEMLGYTREELIGNPVMTLYADTPDGKERAQAVFQRFVDGEDIEDEELQMRRADGGPQWISLSVRANRDEAGNVVDSRSAVLDITARKAAEEALQQANDELERWAMRRAQQLADTTEELEHSKASYREIFDAATDMIIVQDLETGEILDVNAECTRATGYSAEELREMGVAGYSSREEDYAPEKALEYVSKAAAGEPQLFEWAYVDKAGRQHPTEVHLKCATLAGVPRLLGIVRDITERKRAEDTRKRLDERLQQAQKLESLGVLAGGIAHDFNNLLLGVMGNAGLAQMKLRPESPAQKYLLNVAAAAKSAAELTNQMLAYSGKGRFVVQPLHLSVMVEEMGHLLEAIISKKAVIKYEIAQDLPPFQGDASQVRQVVMNLITNASDAIGDRSGVITVTTGVLTADPAYIADMYMDSDLPGGFYVYIEVSDTGCGMDEETRKKIFDPFFTTKVAGRGLGLAALLGIVRGHRGTIKLYSEVGRGTTFKILFPAAGEPAEVSIVKPMQADQWRGTGLVLVADDEELVREAATMILEAVGFQVLAVEDGRECVRVFRTRADDVCLVLLDMTMPHMGGEETFRELRRIRPDVRVVLSSGYNEQEATSSFAGKGLAGFIQKPYSPRQLVEMVRGTLED